MNKDVKYWVDIASYDLKTASAMLKSKRYLYVLFTCQQALEKLLKGFFVKVKEEFPPLIHNLLKLSALISLEFDEETKMFLEDLSKYYLKVRYPKDIQKLFKEINQNLAKDYYRRTQKLWEELYRKLK